MSDNFGNPYESPQAEVNTVNPLSDRVLTEDMLFYLRGAAPWLRFIGILGFISIGISVLFLLIFAFRINSLIPDSAEFGAFSTLSSGMVLIYVPVLALYFFPVLYMFRFGKRLKSYQYTNDSQDLVEAFKNNKSLWTFMGVLTIIGLAIIVLVILIAIITAVSGAFIG
jgi:hypothetical protein